MHILFVESSRSWGGQEYRTCLEINWLIQRGHQAWLVCDRKSEVFAGFGENFAFPVAYEPGLMSALIEPVDLEAGAVFLSAPTATALYKKYVHARSTIATARRAGSGRASDTRAGLTGCRTFFENIVMHRIHTAI